MTTVDKICSPALIYLIFALTQIIIDIFKSLYSQAIFKFIQMIFFTILLNILCMRGLGIVSWMIVFIPFILMTVITGILMTVFGLDPSVGDYTVDVDESKRRRDRRDDRKDRRRRHHHHEHNHRNSDDNSDPNSDPNSDDNSDDNSDPKPEKKETDIIIINQEQHKAYKIENWNNIESDEPPLLNTTSTGLFTQNIYKRI